jgi:hypothetical protein
MLMRSRKANRHESTDLPVRLRCTMVTEVRPASSMSSATSCAAQKVSLKRRTSSIYSYPTCVCSANNNAHFSFPLIAIFVVNRMNDSPFVKLLRIVNTIATPQKERDILDWEVAASLRPILRHLLPTQGEVQ